jgi:3-isopropylmalate dehydratase small subunit
MKKKFECIVRHFGDDFPAGQIDPLERDSGDLFSGIDDIAAKRNHEDCQSNADRIIIGGKNFGTGYCDHELFARLKNGGIIAVIAETISREFYRGAINNGIAVIENAEAAGKFRDGELAFFDFEKGEIKTAQNAIQFEPIPDLHYKIYIAGGLIPYSRKLLGK